MASMKFDFPHAFGPINTFNGVSSTSWPSGPNDRKLVNFRLLRNALILVVFFNAHGTYHHAKRWSRQPLIWLYEAAC
jgi:hypothetical protein